jgi:hypothetical protein
MQPDGRKRLASVSSAVSLQEGRSRSAIGVYAVLDPVEIDPLRTIIDTIQDSMIPDSDPIPFLSRHLEGARRARVLGEEAHSLDDALQHRRSQLIEVLLRLRESEEVIHGAS